MNKRVDPQVFIFTALECEAKSLIKYFSLKKYQPSSVFSIYSNQQITLTVTGVGKIAMAAGVAYTMALQLTTKSPIILNVGIAGQKTKVIGSLAVASKIIDDVSEERFYPQLIGNDWEESYCIKTSATPTTVYKDGFLYDMEAAGFYEIAVRFSSSELIHCIKVISDNNLNTIENINAKLVAEWIAGQANALNTIVERLIKLRQLISVTELEGYQEIRNNWHFTVTGELKLKALLYKWRVLTGENWGCFDGECFTNGKDVLKKLSDDINAQRVKL